MPEEKPTSSSASSSADQTPYAGPSQDVDIEKTAFPDTEKIIAEHDDEISIATSRASTVSDVDNRNKDGKSTASAAIRATVSRTTSVHPDAVVVERRDRRGLFARLCFIPEVEDAYHYVNRTKWVVTAIVAFCGMAGPSGSAIAMPVLGDIAKQFGSSAVVTNMSVGVYMLAMGVCPVWWSAYSESGGRRTVYVISFALFVLFAILSAVATNISMLVVVRTLSGGAAASVQAVGAGTIADMWEPKERGRALGLFYLGPLCGPLLAPIIGGALGQAWGWRSTQWFLVIYGVVGLVLIVFALPETLRRSTPPPSQSQSQQPPETQTALTTIPTRHSVQKKTKSTLTHLRRIFLDPLVVLTWMRHPPVALTVYYASITFGALYFLNISLQATFAKPPYRFSTLALGLLYIPGALGYFLASVFGGRWIDAIMAREARRANRYDEHGKLVFAPEDRMRENAWLAALLWPAALVWYGWGAQRGAFWLVPIIANFFFGVGSMLIFSLATTMLTEFLPRRASAGVAVNNFFRSSLALVGALAAEPIMAAVGNGWLFTVLGVWSLGSGVGVILAMRRWGRGWRERMVEAMG